MIFTYRSSNSSSNVLAPSSSTRIEKNNSHYDHDEVEFSSRKSKLSGRKASIRQQIQARDPICKARRKVAPLGLSSRETFAEEGNLAKTFDDDTSSWLSSGSSSPSCCFDDQIFRNLLDFSLDDWLVSLFISSINSSPRFSRTTTFFDGSRMNPLEEATFVLQRSTYQEDIFQENSLSEEEITTWLMNSVEVKDEDCLCSKRKNSEVPQNWQMQKLGLLGSIIDLDGENSVWKSDTDLNFLQTDFPSPCCKNHWSSGAQSSASSSDFSSLIEAENNENESISSAAYSAEDEYNKLADNRTDEPLFWPCDTKFDWGSEFSWDFLIMSPRKNISKPGKSKGNLRERIKLVMHRAKMDFKGQDDVWIDSTSATTEVLEPNCRSRGKDFVQIKAASEQLRELTNSPMSETSFD